MFSGFMLNTWVVATIVAAVAGVVGFFTVMRASAFAAHAIPSGSFAGAAGAALVGTNAFLGLGLFSVLGALGIGALGRRGRGDVGTALTLTMMLGLGALFLSVSGDYAPGVYSLLFGEVLGVSSNELLPTALLAGVCMAVVAVLYRPLMLSSVLAESGEARGVSSFRAQVAFLLVLALATTMTVPVVGTLLIFSLMIGPPAAARSFTARPGLALALSVAFALLTVWAAIALSYRTNYPIGFYVGSASAACYVVGRGWAAWQRTKRRRTPAGATASTPLQSKP